MSLRATDGDEKAVQDDVEATPALTSTAAVLTSTSHHLPNLPAKDQLMYTACYCEENIYKLCELIKNKETELLDSCYVAFISNASQTVPLWRQRAGDQANDGHIIWDYHVIMIYYHESCNGCTYVYDLDTTLAFPVPLEEYVWKAFKPQVPLKHGFRRHIRCLGARDYLATFASNRQRMRRPDGAWIKPPPPYAPIANTISSNNLEWFIDMRSSNGVPGIVLNQFNFCKQFNAHLDRYLFGGVKNENIG
ncbi:protein N-terminal glutamine amidohydrolase-like [Varroa jacobsoni]|uniref:Protein N-terminal glutamine amidohydrolase n=1 Tax=Varroa destructor TaxID=109461 RepID=A0A7M7M8I7_VARDE|nr:protein N-terminal glutamine amidohydrolase-like [Varroa destructor]XP_022697807.1 protein N-terminal glutamine amidohydrolase-like [Varroa jacobsoni]